MGNTKSLYCSKSYNTSKWNSFLKIFNNQRSLILRRYFRIFQFMNINLKIWVLFYDFMGKRIPMKIITSKPNTLLYQTESNIFERRWFLFVNFRKRIQTRTKNSKSHYLKSASNLNLRNNRRRYFTRHIFRFRHRASSKNKFPNMSIFIKKER